jgi:hypothetical protein
MRNLFASFCLLIIVIVLSNSVTAQIPTATLTSDSVLVEHNLDGRLLTINLTEEIFLDYTALQITDFVLKNYPTGLSIQNVNGISPTQVNIQLAFDGTDIDMFFNFVVGIRHSVLKNTDTLALYTNSLNIGFYLEHPVATITADSILTERRLDSRVLDIDLIEERFINYTSLLISNFVLVNSPAGLTIESVQGISPTQAKICLAFDGTDFDTNILNFHLNISSSVLFQTVTGYLATISLVIFSSVEPPVAFMTNDSGRDERRLGLEILSIDLANEIFLNYMSLITTDFALINAPAGLTIESVTGMSPTRAVLDLAFDGTDFDTNYTDFKVGINHSVLMYTATGVLYTNSLVIRAYVENPIAELSSDSSMYESRLDYRILTINLKEERFLDYTSLLVSDFVLVNAPAGLTIESILGLSPTKAKIVLAFDQTDFDELITDFLIKINSHVLIQTTVGYLATNNLSIFPTGENSLFSISADSINFKEWNYNQRKIVRTPEIGIVAESNNEILFSYDLNAPVKIFDGKNASLAVDKNSSIHIVYEDNGIKYSVKPKLGNWQTSIIISDSSEIGFSPIADCDKDGNIHILYGVKDSCDNGNTYLCSLKYVKVSNDQKQESSIIYDIKDENEGDTLMNYTIATDLLFMDKTVFLVYQLSNDSIYVKYSTDYGVSWKKSIEFPGTNPALSIGFETFYEGSYDPSYPYYDPFYPDPNTYPVILYKDAAGNLINRYAEFYSDHEDFYWEESNRIYDGPIDYLCIDDLIPWNPVKPFGYSNIFQKDSILYHAFSDFYENHIMDTLTDNVLVSSIAYKQFDPEKVDIIWYEKNGDLYEMFYQWFEKVPPAPPIELTSIHSEFVCHGASDGFIYTFVTGGIPPYHYYWSERDSTIYTYLSTGSGNQYFYHLSAGIYFMTVYDWNSDRMIDTTFELPEVTVETGEIVGPIEVHVSETETDTYSVKETPLSYYEWTVIGGTILSGQGTNSIIVRWGSPGSGNISVFETDFICGKGESVSLDVIITATGYYYTSLTPINVFPNPIKDKATIQFPNSQGYSYDLVIMDLTGKIVRIVSKINGSSYELNRDGLPAGLYLIELRGPNIYRGKIIIE